MITSLMELASDSVILLMGGNYQSQIVMVILGGYGVFKIRQYYKTTEEGFDL